VYMLDMGTPFREFRGYLKGVRLFLGPHNLCIWFFIVGRPEAGCIRTLLMLALPFGGLRRRLVRVAGTRIRRKSSTERYFCS
jgi:hypothetical protein